MTPYQEKTISGDMVWRVAYYVNGRRVRRTFESKTHAEDWARIHRGIGDREGRKFLQLWLSITPKEQHETLDTLSLMRAHRKKLPQSSLTLVQAAAAQITVAEEVQASLLLAEAVDNYIKTKKNNKRKGSVSQGWYVVLDKCLHRAARELPDKTLPEFTSEEIEEWLDDQDWSPRTYNNYRDYLYSVFKWACPKYVKVNPVASIEKYAKKFITSEVIVPDIATVTRVFRLMRKKKYRHLLPARDLCFGLALRSSEAKEMTWENIREQVIQVPNAIAKGGRGRNISRRPLLEGIFRSLLAQKGNQTGRILPKGWRREAHGRYGRDHRQRHANHAEWLHQWPGNGSRLSRRLANRS